MFLYRSAAIGKPFGMIDLPDAINLSDASLASTYAQAHFQTRDGHDFRGTPISFSATVLASAHDHIAAARFVDFLVGPAGQEIVEAFHDDCEQDAHYRRQVRERAQDEGDRDCGLTHGGSVGE